MAGLNVVLMVEGVVLNSLDVSNNKEVMDALEQNNFPLIDLCRKLDSIALNHNIVIDLKADACGVFDICVAPEEGTQISILSVQESFTLALELYSAAHHAPLTCSVKLSDNDPVILYPDVECSFGDVVGAIKFDPNGRSMVVGIINKNSGILTHTIDPIRGIVCDMDGNECDDLTKTIGESMKLWYTANWRIGNE